MTTFVKPDFPQTSIRFVGETVARVAPSFADVVAVPMATDWGPMGVDISSDADRVATSFPEFEQKYGTSDTAGRRAVLSAFNGIGLPGQGGAGGVIPYRMATADADFATLTLDNTAAADALVLTAAYKGTRGNRLKAVVGDDPQDNTKDRLRILFDGAEVERYTYAPTAIAALAADVNARSVWVSASGAVNGTALAVTPAGGTALAGGDDGDVLTGTEYLEALTALQYAQFSVLAFPNLTDAGISATVLAWVQSQENANRPVMLVVGGAAGESVSAAITRSATFADPHVVNLGVGTYHDDLLDRDVSTAELAPRIAGVLAARGRDKALTGAEIGGLSNVGATGIETDDIRAAIDGGVTVLRRTSSADAELVIAQGVTTYISKSDDARPYNVFSEPRFIRIMDIFIRRVKGYGDTKIVGDLPVTQEARDAVRAFASTEMAELLRTGLIMAEDAARQIPAPFVSTPIPSDAALSDAILFEFGWQFTPTTNYVLGQGRVRA